MKLWLPITTLVLGLHPRSQVVLDHTPRLHISIYTLVVDSVVYNTGSCKMMFPVSYLVYSVNCVVCLLMTTRTNWIT